MSVSAYRPRRAWESPLYHAVAENLETFLAGRQLCGHPAPFFVVRDFRAFLDCGVPAHGFPLAYDREWIAAVHHVFLNAVFASLRRRTGLSSLGRNAKGGAVTFVQRFGDALNLNVHFHALALDGVSH